MTRFFSEDIQIVKECMEKVFNTTNQGNAKENKANVSKDIERLNTISEDTKWCSHYTESGCTRK